LNPGKLNAVEDYGTKYLQLGDKIFFIASEKEGVRNLYVVENNKVDLLKEVCSSCDAYSYLFEFKNRVYFTTTGNGKHQIYSTNGTKDDVKLEKSFGESFRESQVLPSRDKIYYYEYNVGIHVWDSNSDIVVPNTRFLDLNIDSPNENIA
jgi:ribosomal protein S27AE